MKRTAKNLLIIIFAVLILELFVFNVKFWLTVSNDTIRYNNADIELGPGIIYDSNTDKYTIVDPNQSYISFVNVNRHINSISFNILFDEEYTKFEDVYVCPTCQIIADDDGNSLGLNAGTITISPRVSESTYKMIHLSGDSKFVEFYIKANENADINTFTINDISLNPNVPFFFSFVRFFIILFLCIFVYALRPSGKLYTYKMFKFESDGGNQKSKNNILPMACILLTFLFSIIVCCFVGVVINPDDKFSEEHIEDWPAHNQYNELADAIVKGQLYLDREPPEELLSLDNPYDAVYRDVLMKDKIDYDYAYYNGKYYSYFGIVPALIFFVPYLIITGHNILSFKYVIMMTILTIFVIYAFIYELCYKYFRNVNVAVYTLAVLFMTFATSWIYLVYLGDVYSVPIISAVFFSLLGITLWIKSTRNDTPNKMLILLGSFCIALTLGCRPQFVITALFACAIFWDETIKKRLFFSKKGVVNTVLIIIPFFAVGVGVMYYNYARFGSPFDFGATYNLTSNDMNHRGVVLSRIPLGIFTYLFMPLRVSGSFPFIELGSTNNDYLGATNYEVVFGGAIFFNCLFVINVIIYRIRWEMHKHKVLLFALIALALGIIIMLLDMQVAGLVGRYQSDFCWLFAISTVIMIFSIDSIKCNNNIVRLRKNILLMGVLFTIILNIWSIFIDGRHYALRESNPDLYLTVKSMVEFY